MMSKNSEATDTALVGRSRDGDRTALEELVRRYQRWVYNVALRMVWSTEDARDVTQEVLMKIITKLSSFRGRSSFRTWVYRITANHVLNMKRRGAELSTLSFEDYAERINRCPDDDPPDPATVPVASEILVEESKLACMTGMLLCLDREQRLTFILGGILNLDARTAAAVIGTSQETYRKRLSRARRDLKSFMDGQCGLANPANPCRCEKKTRAYIKAGVVDPLRLKFHESHMRSVQSSVSRRSRELEESLRLFVEHPYYEGPDLIKQLRSILDNGDLGRVTDLFRNDG